MTAAKISPADFRVQEIENALSESGWEYLRDENDQVHKTFSPAAPLPDGLLKIKGRKKYSLSGTNIRCAIRRQTTSFFIHENEAPCCHLTNFTNSRDVETLIEIIRSGAIQSIFINNSGKNTFNFPPSQKHVRD